MKKILFAITIAFVVSVYAATPDNHKTLAPMLKNVMPAVVNITVRGRISGIQLQLNKSQPNVQVKPKFAGVGSGVIIDAQKGFVITNAHVVKDAKIIIVTLNDKRRLQGKLVGMDPKSDIAVIQIHAKHLTAIPFGDSDELKIGDYVTAIGNPFGLGQTVTSGVVSGLNRSNLGIEGYENFIQTDAPINPGNSGGALVDLNGKLIGMNTAIVSPVGANVGIGFAIPSNMCKIVVEQIIKYGKVEHSIIGVIIQNINPTLADAMNLPNTKGALVTQVNPHTPAADAGLKEKDVIVKLDDKPVRNSTQVSNTIGLMRPGTAISLQIRRNGKLKTLHAVIESLKEAKKAAAKADKPILSGLALRDFSQLENNRQITGVQIIGVDDFSVAYSYGLRPGDVITATENKTITNIKQLQKVAARHPNKLLLKIQRGMGSIFVVLEK